MSALPARGSRGGTADQGRPALRMTGLDLCGLGMERDVPAIVVLHGRVARDRM